MFMTLPALRGGTLITVTSGNPAIVGVATPTVLIAAGTLSGNAQLQGIALGEVAVIAAGPNLATGTSSVRVTATLDIVESNVTINAGFSTTSITTRLLSGGIPFAAPEGGIPLTFSSRAPACVAAPSALDVPVGLSSIATTAGYGGTAATPCSTYLVVTSSAFDTDSVRITVNPKPVSYLSMGATVGAGLTRTASFSFEALAPPGGALITVSSSDSTRLVLSASPTTVGTGSVLIPIAAGSYYGSFYYSGIEGQAGATATVTMTSQNDLYTPPPPVVVTINPIGIEASGSTTFTTLSTDGNGTVLIGEITAPGPGQAVYNESTIRAGGVPVVTTLTSTNAGVALPVTAGVAANPRTVTIAPGQSRVSYNIRPTGAGTSSITATSPGAATPVRTGYPSTITVSQPLSYLSVGPSVGAGLARAASFSLQEIAPAGGTVITLTSSDSTRLVLSNTVGAIGTGSLEITIPAGSYYASFYYAGIEGQAGTTATVSMTVPSGQFANPAPATVTINPIGIEASGSTTLTTLGSDGSGTVIVGELTAGGPYQSVTLESVVRAGGTPISSTLASTTPTVAVPVVDGIAASPRTLTLDPGQSRANYTMRPLVAGTTTFTAVSAQAGSPVRAGYPSVVTVNSPANYISVPARLGAGLAAAGSASLQVVSPVGGVTMTLTSSDPSRILLAPDYNTAGSAQITLPIAQGGYYVSFVVMALEDVTGSPTVTVQATGFTDASGAVSVEPIGVQWSGAASLTTLSTDGSGTAYIGIISGVLGNRSVSPEQVVRFGGVPRTITLTSSNPAVVLPVVGSTAQQGITTTIIPGQSRATVNVRPTGIGTAILAPTGNGLISADAPNVPQSVTVTAPVQYLSVSSFSQGAGLSQTANISLQVVVPAGGRTMTLTSSDPSRLLVARDGTSAGSGQISISFAAGAYYDSFVIMSPENVTGTVSLTASLPGFRDTTFTFTVVQPAVTLNGPQPTRTVAQGDDYFQAQVGVPNGAGVQPQEVRFSAPAALTVTLVSSAPAIGTLVIGGNVASPQTIQIPAGQSITSAIAGSRANFRPLSAGNTTITATIPGHLQQGSAIRTVTVSP